MEFLPLKQKLVVQPKRGSGKTNIISANSDMLIKLPDNVIDQILMHLPITEAVRTSVLSTKWRYKWKTITQLVFPDLNLGRHVPVGLQWRYDEDKLLNFVDRVLLLHSGFIHTFELSSQCLPASSIIESFDRWILFLSTKNIKEFVLKFRYRADRSDEYTLPTCFFSAQQISTLELHYCVLKPPPAFTGFSKLKSLCLSNTVFVDKFGFECLISKCPLLERLNCDMFFDNPHLNISSPNLKYLCLRGNLEDICFENTPLLSDVSITFLDTENETETRNVVVDILSSLPNLRKFVVGLYFMEFLSLSKIPEKLPFTCHHLTYLSMDPNFEFVNGICVILCLINSSPNLRELHIRCRAVGMSSYDIESFWEKRTLIDWNMSVLQIVKIEDIQGFESELEFIKLLLANSPMLEMLIIRFDELDFKHRYVFDELGFKHRINGFEFLEELEIFPRASPKANIEFLEVLEEPDDF